MSIRRIAARGTATVVAGLAVAALAGPAQAAGNGPEGATALTASASSSTSSSTGATDTPRERSPGHFIADGVNIRRTPGGSDILGKGYRGQKVTMICLDWDSLRWLKITNHATGVTGFVDAKFIKADGPAPPQC